MPTLVGFVEAAPYRVVAQESFVEAVEIIGLHPPFGEPESDGIEPAASVQEIAPESTRRLRKVGSA